MITTTKYFILFTLFFNSVFAIFSYNPNETLVQIEPILDNYQKWKTERNEFIRYSTDYPFGWNDFQCTVPTIVDEPSDVHHVAPWHISVIAAMGDSLTAGRAAAASSLSQISDDFRGLSFAIGEDFKIEEYATLPSIFRRFSKSLFGSSHGISDETRYSLSQFNVAKSGAKAHDLPRQARELVKRMKLELNFRYFTEWKFINIFIGSNDLCDFSLNETLYGPETYIQSFHEALTYLKENMPRAYIHIMPAFNVSVLATTHSNNPFCIDFHKITCPSLFEKSPEELQGVKAKMDKYLETFMTDSYQADDFSIIIAPVISSISNLPIIGSSVNIAFTALDCFHFSVIAHDMVAKIVWNRLFQNVFHREKLSNFEEFDPRVWKCPPESCPYLRTKKNSIECTENAHNSLKLRIEPVVLPSQDELENRLSEDGNVIITISLYFIGLMLMVTFMILIITTIQKKLNKKNKKKAYEGTPLLLTANLYDDLF